MKLPKNFNIKGNKSCVLVAPLDWGLGHATRCIPVIKELLSLNYTVLIGASKSTEVLLKNEFPQLTFLPIDGYNITYSKTKVGLWIKLITQLPKIARCIKKEKKWLQQIIEQYNIELIISDNRPGLYSKQIKSIYLTHQLTIKANFSFIERQLQKLHYKFINKFTECWVPDYEGENNLAGDLSHPKIEPTIPVKYINPLTRFIRKEMPVIYDAAIVLSGPEPQRTIFENIILAQLKNTTKNIILVRGLPQHKSILNCSQPNVVIYNFLATDELNRVMLQSSLIISRSGYSTIMDLEVLEKKAVLVPTPGQTEQEYLAKLLEKKEHFIFINQHEFNLQKIL